MMTGEEYRESLRRLKHEVYYMGERIECLADHPAIQPHINAAAATYDLACDPETEDLGAATSHITGERISRFTHIHQSPEELVRKVKMLRALGQRTGTCFQRCVGHDALNALFSVTYDIDAQRSTSYHSRFLDYLRYIQKTDFMVDGAMTDPKGDRSLPPSKQPDPDQYLRVVERRAASLLPLHHRLHHIPFGRLTCLVPRQLAGGE